MLRWLSRSQQASSALWAQFPRKTPVRGAHRSLASHRGGPRSPETPAGPHVELNDDIAGFPRVRLIGENGEVIGEMSGLQALDEARTAQRDVLTVHKPRSSDVPPVVRLVDYDAMIETRRRNSYASQKGKRESARVDRRITVLKQVRLSPSTGDHDFRLKLKQARNFLLEGYRLRLFMQFRRGQGRLQEDAKGALARATKELVAYGSLVGTAKGTEVTDLFPSDPVVEGNENDAEAPAGVRKKAKPLEVLFQPLRKKDREQLQAATTEKDADNDG